VPLNITLVALPAGTGFDQVASERLREGLQRLLLMFATLIMRATPTVIVFSPS
jgi:hypothetical protein